MAKLRPIASGVRVEKPNKLSVTEAAQLNDHRGLLVALHSRIAAAVQAVECPPVALAALSRQLTLISKEIERVDARAEVDGVRGCGQMYNDRLTRRGLWLIVA